MNEKVEALRNAISMHVPREGRCALEPLVDALRQQVEEKSRRIDELEAENDKLYAGIQRRREMLREKGEDIARLIRTLEPFAQHGRAAKDWHGEIGPGHIWPVPTQLLIDAEVLLSGGEREGGGA